MASQYFFEMQDIETKEIAPGFFSKLIHTADNTLNFIEVKAGNKVALHRHPHAQSSFVLEGSFEMTIENETRLLEPGLGCYIPGDALHGGQAITDCKLLDIFSPVREEYQKLGGLHFS